MTSNMVGSLLNIIVGGEYFFKMNLLLSFLSMFGYKEFFNKQSYIDSYIKPYPENNINLKIIRSLQPNKRVLSLGCGAGREVRELVKNGHKVTAIDFAEKQIDSSMKIEPRAEYICADAISWVNDNHDKTFDYILGLHSFLNYIPKEIQREFINQLKSMLSNDGKIIFEVRMSNETFKSTIRYMFGLDSHHFSKRELKGLLSYFDYKLEGSVITITR